MNSGNKDNKYPKTPVKYDDTDAKFKCFAGSCGATKLSYREFICGACCEAAMERIPVLESCTTFIKILELNKLISIGRKAEHEVMSKMFLQIKEENSASHGKIVEAQNELYSARQKVHEAEAALKKAKLNVPVAEQKVKSAQANQALLRKLHEKSEKRILIITNAAFHGNGKMTKIVLT